MSCLYKRGKSLWVAFKDERGARVCRPTGYKVGEEAAARLLLVELERKAADAAASEADRTLQVAAEAPIVGQAADRTLQGAPQARTAEAGPATRTASANVGPTVREYGERWLLSREAVETIGDERGRLRNHVFPKLGDLRMRDVRPRHIRDFILELKISKVHLRGTGKGLGTEKIAPRTVRHVFALLRRMFSAAVIDEVIETSPVTVAKGVLPKNVDKDPAWRATALYERGELVRLISDPIVPPDRRILNSIKGLSGTRHGEAAGLRWSNYIVDATPLGKLVVARSYEKDGTKTKVSRLVPVHPVLAQLLDAWKRSGWAAMYGRAPAPADFIVPRSIVESPEDEDGGAELWDADRAHKLFLSDLEALGLRRRRGHDLRRTFITLAQEDGAERDVLQVITHAPNPEDVMSLYTTFPWPRLCAAVAKLRITLPDPSQAQPAAADSGEPISAERAAMQALATARRSMEPRRSPDPVVAEVSGAPRSFGGVAVARSTDCSATVSATCSAEIPVISSRCPGMIRGPTVYETVALPLSYSGVVRG
jgi:integrase